MKHEPRPAIHMRSSLGGPVSWVGQSVGISKAGQMVLARLMELQVWHQLGSSVLCGAGLEKGQWPLFALMPDTSVSPSMPLVPYQGATLVLELRGSESEKVSPYVGSLRGTVWGSRSFSH